MSELSLGIITYWKFVTIFKASLRKENSFLKVNETIYTNVFSYAKILIFSNLTANFLVNTKMLFTQKSTKNIVIYRTYLSDCCVSTKLG